LDFLIFYNLFIYFTGQDIIGFRPFTLVDVHEISSWICKKFGIAIVINRQRLTSVGTIAAVFHIIRSVNFIEAAAIMGITNMYTITCITTSSRSHQVSVTHQPI
jgi:hypothetical protein